MLVQNRVTFDRKTEIAIVIRDILIWLMLLFSILIEIFKEISDYTFIVILIILIAIMTFLILNFKAHLQN